LLDGKQSDFTEEDMSRRNAIAHLLEEWGLLLIVSADKYQEPKAKISSIKIIPFKEKKEWILESKYTIGKKKLDQ
jgi:hypothetical protein